MHNSSCIDIGNAYHHFLINLDLKNCFSGTTVKSAYEQENAQVKDGQEECLRDELP